MYVTFAKTVVTQMGIRQSLARLIPLRIYLKTHGRKHDSYNDGTQKHLYKTTFLIFDLHSFLALTCHCHLWSP